MSELKIKFIYNGEKSLFRFLKCIEYDIKDKKFDRYYWSGDVLIEDKTYKEKDKDLTFILFKILFALGDRENIFIEMNLWA